MILDGEALAFTNKDYVYIADSYNPIKEDLKGNRYENISLAFSDKYFDKNFDEVLPVEPKKIYIPKMTHPWKRETFEKFAEKQIAKLQKVS